MRNLMLLLALICASFQVSALSGRVSSDSSMGYVKVYVAPQITKSDVLFVIDNSGSMGKHQANFAANIPALVNPLMNAGLNVNTAILTVDMDDVSRAGRFLYVRNSQSPTFLSDLSRDLLVGNMGSGVEQHFAALKASLTSPLLETSNAGFLRGDAHLTVIFVTDAEDQSDAALTEQGMADFLTQLKGSAGVSVYSFMSPAAEATCAKDNNDFTPRLETMVGLMGGSVFSLCSPDWQTPMQTIFDKSMLEITRTIQLPTTPVVATIEVRFGSKVLTGGDMLGGWTYDAAQNAIVMGKAVDYSGQAIGTELEIKFVPTYWK